MADDVTLNGALGAFIAATDKDEASGEHFQLVKLVFGPRDQFKIVGDAEPIPMKVGVGGAPVDGRKVVTAAGTREALVGGATPARQVVITALAGNTDVVVVGGSTVVAALAGRRGAPLAAGDSLSLDVRDLAEVFLDTVVSGEGVSFLAVV